MIGSTGSLGVRRYTGQHLQFNIIYNIIYQSNNTAAHGTTKKTGSIQKMAVFRK